MKRAPKYMSIENLPSLAILRERVSDALDTAPRLVDGPGRTGLEILRNMVPLAQIDDGDAGPNRFKVFFILDFSALRIETLLADNNMKHATATHCVIPKKAVRADQVMQEYAAEQAKAKAAEKNKHPELEKTHE